MRRRQRRVGEGPIREQSGQRDQAEAIRRGRKHLAPVAECRGRDGVPLALVGHHKREGQVDDDSGTAKQGEHDEADAVDRRMDVEVAGEPAGDPGDHAVGPASVQTPGVSVGECVCVLGHGSTIAEPGCFSYPECP